MALLNGWLRLFFVGAVVLGPFLGWKEIRSGARETQGEQGQVVILDRDGSPVTRLTDGDTIQLQVTLASKMETATPVQFILDGLPVQSCTVSVGEDHCQTEPFHSLGWHWSEAGSPAPERTLNALVGGSSIGEVRIQVDSRPVVMVHGFASDWSAWANYLGAEGYLAQVGIKGYAVGDGQVPGRMNTGSLDDPAGQTNTIHQNAEIVGQTIAQVKQVTGAEMVDLLAHSMGGLISRYYIDTWMAERDVAQLIMLGSPMAGTECANLPASLGLYLPATLEIRPSYVTAIFNHQITHRKGLAFHALAGNPILEAFKSPCTSVPTDLAVSQQSVSAISLDFQTMPVLHIDLNTSRKVFLEFVLPLLVQGPEKYQDQPDPPPQPAADEPIQFSRVFTGQLAPGQTQEIVIPIEEGVTVASFALYDTSRSLQVEVRGASGNVIELTAEKNGLVVVDDPSALLYLGYGFQDPKPGEWRVTLLTTTDTPPEGAAYALTAYMVGGVKLRASALPLLPQVNDQVTLEASLTFNGQALPIRSAQAGIQQTSGERATLDLAVENGQARLEWQPGAEGLYGIDLLVAGQLPDGTVIERSAFLSIQAQPTEPPTRTTLLVIVLILVIIFLAILLFGVLILLRKRKTD